MAIPRVDLTYRNIQRYRQIINVFLGYGFGHLIERLDLGSYVDVGRRILRRRPTPFESLGFPLRLRMAFEELGPTFVKLGQILAMQSAGLPNDLLDELARLHDRAAPIPSAVARGSVERTLGRRIEKVFARFDDMPLAAASIAQVHRAALLDGTEVVIKIRRPEIVRIVQTDTNILRDLARLIARHLPELRRYDPIGLVEQLTSTMLKEVDFRHEARNMRVFAANMKEQPGIRVPRLHRDLVSEEVLVLDFVEGIKISDLDALRERGHDLHAIARNGTNAILTQVFRDGFFHADPHPGNLFVLDEGSIALIDFGMMGRLPADLRDELALLMIALVRRNRDGIIGFFERTGGFPDDEVPARFRVDLDEVLDHYHGVPIGELDVNSMAGDLFGALNRNDIHPPPELVLLLKTLVMYDALACRLDPTLDLVTEATPYIKEILSRRYSPERIGGLIADAAVDYADFIRVLPRELKGLTNRLRKGRQTLVVRHDGLEDFRHEMERSSNRLTLGLVVGAVVVASSILLSTDAGPTLWGVSALGLAGFVAAGFASVWLVIGILRSGRL